MSMIKMKQPSVPGINPSFMKKVSRGVQPVDSLLHHISDQYERFFGDSNHSFKQSAKFKKYDEAHNYAEPNYLNEDEKHLRYTTCDNVNYHRLNTYEPLYEEDEVLCLN